MTENQCYTGQGHGQVNVILEERNIRFIENGSWFDLDGKIFQFENHLQWTYVSEDQIDLAHMRHDKKTPTRLIQFIADESGLFKAKAPFHCGKDCYEASIDFSVDAINLQWKISGPHKSQLINTRYGC